MAVVGAAMDLRARFGTSERGEETGSASREMLLREIGMGARGKCALCAQPGTAKEARVLWFERSCVKTCRHTFESRWIASGS